MKNLFFSFTLSNYDSWTTEDKRRPLLREELHASVLERERESEESAVAVGAGGAWDMGVPDRP